RPRSARAGCAQGSNAPRRPSADHPNRKRPQSHDRQPTTTDQYARSAWRTSAAGSTCPRTAEPLPAAAQPHRTPETTAKHPGRPTPAPGKPQPPPCTSEARSARSSKPHRLSAAARQGPRPRFCSEHRRTSSVDATPTPPGESCRSAQTAVPRATPTPEHLDAGELVQQPDSGSLRTPLNLRDVVLTDTGQPSDHGLCLAAPLPVEPQTLTDTDLVRSRHVHSRRRGETRHRPA